MPSIRPEKLIIMDKDGTVLDTNEATLEAHVETLSSYPSSDVIEVIDGTQGYAPDKQYAILRLMKERNLTFEDIIANALNKYASRLEELRTDSTTLELVDNLWENLKKVKPKAFPDALDAVSLLKKSGYTLVMSGGYRVDITEAQLSMLDIRKYFDLVLGYPKGEKHIETVMKKYGLDKEKLKQVSIVGDGRGDMELGRPHGMILYGIDRTGNVEKSLKTWGAMEVFHNLRECADYILRRH